MKQSIFSPHPLFSMQGLVLLMILAVVGCSNSKPILYPNEHLKSAGTETAEQDIEACEKMAKEAGANQGSGQAGRVAGSTAVGAGVGAASGAVGGAVVGAAGSGSLIGAASGAVWGLLSGIFGAFFGDSEPNPTYRNFVNRCLQEKGYEVAGWE